MLPQGGVLRKDGKRPPGDSCGPRPTHGHPCARLAKAPAPALSCLSRLRPGWEERGGLSSLGPGMVGCWVQPTPPPGQHAPRATHAATQGPTRTCPPTLCGSFPWRPCGQGLPHLGKRPPCSYWALLEAVPFAHRGSSPQAGPSPGKQDRGSCPNTPRRHLAPWGLLSLRPQAGTENAWGTERAAARPHSGAHQPLAAALSRASLCSAGCGGHHTTRAQGTEQLQAKAPMGTNAPPTAVSACPQPAVTKGVTCGSPGPSSPGG